MGHMLYDRANTSWIIPSPSFFTTCKYILQNPQIEYPKRAVILEVEAKVKLHL